MALPWALDKITTCLLFWEKWKNKVTKCLSILLVSILFGPLFGLVGCHVLTLAIFQFLGAACGSCVWTVDFPRDGRNKNISVMGNFDFACLLASKTTEHFSHLDSKINEIEKVMLAVHGTDAHGKTSPRNHPKVQIEFTVDKASH
jgi:hypothetical protein